VEFLTVLIHVRSVSRCRIFNTSKSELQLEFSRNLSLKILIEQVCLAVMYLVCNLVVHFSAKTSSIDSYSKRNAAVLLHATSLAYFLSHTFQLDQSVGLNLFKLEICRSQWSLGLGIVEHLARLLESPLEAWAYVRVFLCRSVFCRYRCRVGPIPHPRISIKCRKHSQFQN